jgi:hypothetical protein
MRRAPSANKNPHVVRQRIAGDRDYLRPDEANAIIDAPPVRSAGKGSATRFFCG